MSLHMARVAIKLTPKHTGGYSARKRIPADVSAEYSRQFSKSAEERFTTGPDVSHATAKTQIHEWLAEIESRIASIRAARRGGGRALTKKQALALAGEWYVWFVKRHEDAPGRLSQTSLYRRGKNVACPKGWAYG
jgi:hypothetical protein